MNDFSFKRDFKLIIWSQTLLLNLVRAAIAGVIWFALSGGKTPSLLLLPVVYLFVFMPIGLFCAFLSSIGVPFVGWLAVLAAIVIVVSDPFMFIIHKIKPQLIPVKEYGFFNFKLILFALKE